MINASISSAFGLELIEALLLNYTEVFETHLEQADILLKHVMPLVNRCLSERHSFSVTVRAIRVFCILMREHLNAVHTECEIAFSLLNHVIETETQQPWRRALCMETFRLLYSDPELFVKVYSVFDMAGNRRNSIQDNLSLFVRVASEKPFLIGMGQGSTVPVSRSSSSASPEQAVLEAETAAGMIGSDFGVSEKNVPGISVEWSSLKISCLDQLDKNEGPTVPETYIHSLALTCINQLSDVLAKIVLPIAMNQGRSRKAKSPDRITDEDGNQQSERPASSQSKLQGRQSSRSHRSRSIPTNPLDLNENPADFSVKVVASLISSSWPAMLATSSTFFNAALDSEFYRSLVRSFQKFTQVAGILRLATPRDALLTALAKVAVPPALLSGDSITSPTSGLTSPGASIRIKGLPSPMTEGLSSSSGHETPTKMRRASTDIPGPMLTQRNLMCLRALVHLAIALGPILDHAWSIVLDSMQKAHVLLLASRSSITALEYRSSQAQTESAGSQPTLSSEIVAVEGAMSRLFSSSGDYPQKSFRDLLSALCNLLQSQHSVEEHDVPAPSPSTLAAPPKLQRRVPSVSGLVTSAEVQPEYAHFAIAKLGEIAKANLSRLAQCSRDGGWNLLLQTLVEVVTSNYMDDVAKKLAADVIARLAAEACISTISLEEDLRIDVQERCFTALNEQIEKLQHSRRGPSTGTELDVHLSALESLRSILEHCGESIITGWKSIFSIASSVFILDDSHPDERPSRETHRGTSAKALSAKLARSSFASVQLICSDFIDSIPQQSFPMLVTILSRFGLQTLDLNISLTVVTLFWNVSDHLRKQTTEFDFAEIDDAALNKESGLRNDDPSQSVSIVWMNLQQQLAELTGDLRADVRNGSVHIIYRTLDSCITNISNRALDRYFHTVLFKAVEIDSHRQRDISSEETSEDIVKAFTNTSRIIIEGFARLFTANLDQILSLSAFPQLWHSFLDKFAVYLDAGSYSLSGVIFSTLRLILAADSESRQLPRPAIDEVASLWARDIPRPRDSSDIDAQAQEKAYVDYVKCMQQIYQKLQSQVSAHQTEIVLERMQECLLASQAQPYTSDADNPTQLQQEVLNCCLILRQSSNGAIPKIIEQLANFVCFPLEQTETSKNHIQLTHIAFAKQAVEMVKTLVTEYKSRDALFEGGAVITALKSAARVIEQKYTLKTQGKSAALWRVVTSAILSILSEIIPAIDQISLDLKYRSDFWNHVVRVAAAIQGTVPDVGVSNDDIIADETLELESIASFRQLVTASLDNLDDLDEARARYVRSLFASSTIHTSTFDDVEDSQGGTLEEDARNIAHIRLGRTFDPPFNPRVRMCYSCLDELFDLATTSSSVVRNGNEEQPVVRQKCLLVDRALLAIIVRCAAPLKRYVADQPLRGRMPTPMSQRLELLHILRRIHESTRSNEDSVEPTYESNAKEILRRLAPLISRARELTRNDRELANAMGKVVARALPS